MSGNPPPTGGRVIVEGDKLADAIAQAEMLEDDAKALVKALKELAKQE